MKNAYPEKPVLNYIKTSVEMGDVVNYLKALPVPVEVKRSAYIMFRNESANGKSGVNNNYAGVQADSGRWPQKWDDRVDGVVVKNENGTGKTRYFVAFKLWTDSVDFLVERVEDRGLYIGGYARLVAKMQIDNLRNLTVAYHRDWVTGNPNYLPTTVQVNNFEYMYLQSQSLF